MLALAIISTIQLLIIAVWLIKKICQAYDEDDAEYSIIAMIVALIFLLSFVVVPIITIWALY